MKNYQSVKPKKPVNIALSFSGGGFRAASFSLGCLSYLEQLEFDNVPFIGLVKFGSSASGGTITLLSYSVAKRKSRSFKDYFNWMVNDVLHGENLVNLVFEIMHSSKEWSSRPDKSRNLINAFSIAYDKKIFEGEKFGILWKDGGIPGVCANTTEFQNGLSFRFQNQGDVGNRFINVVSDVDFKEIKLGDILACSSCFPVGFEPFVYPKDFSYEGLDKEVLREAVAMDNRYVNNERDTSDLFPLMDGGIDDNQGIDSFMNAEARLERSNGFGYDLYMTCDVSSNYTSGYQYPSQRKPGWLGRRSLLFYISLIFLFLFAGILGAAFKFCIGFSYALIGITSFLTTILLVLYLKLVKIRKKASTQNSTELLLILKHLGFFLRLDVSILIHEISARLTSTGQMAAVIFLKKIRRASYAGLFRRVTPVGDTKGAANPDGPDIKSLKFWGQFSVMNAVYMLSTKNKKQCESDLRKEAWTKKGLEINVGDEIVDAVTFMTPSEDMIKIADLATKMETTLWYDAHHIDQGQPIAVIVAGQFTTCYNLLRWSLRFTDEKNETVWSDFRQELISQYAKFKTDPYWLYNAYSS